ncbi:MAG TPA: GtrA family protein [Sphingobium sp.]|uniref:GtrA family protein n=1 Tax=Sphingobium sp. TaxID=1912891 RepID=UPI002ED6B25B
MQIVKRVMGHPVLGQLLRYGLVGGSVTALQAAVYWLLAEKLDWHPQLANVAGYACAVVTGYFAHGAISFRGQAEEGHSGARMARFVTVSLLSLALNALWVWLTVTVLHGPLWAPIPFMGFVTPMAVFVLNRQWVYR